MSEYRIAQIAFEDGGVVVQYIELPTDLRVGGQLMKTHQLHVGGAHADYVEDIEALHRRAERLLANALEDFEASEPYDPEVDDEDEGKGMGDH